MNKKPLLQLTLVNVMSVDGRITRHSDNDIYTWTSQEDKEYFSSLIAQASLIIMGRKTYEAIRSFIKLKLGTLRVVMTHHPELFAKDEVPGQLEFKDEPIETMLNELADRHLREGLVVGGSAITTAFLNAKQLSRMLLTIEPLFFGSGTPVVGALGKDIDLKLIKTKQLNKRGTLLLEYKII